VERKWEIKIDTIINGDMKINIQDNGVGMKQADIDLLNDRFKSNNMDFDQHGLTDKPSVGLINIDSRIKLLYGKQYGLHIEENKPYGVTVTITLPIEGDIK
jgi:two-component system sensor histidine kinase YesM